MSKRQLVCDCPYTLLYSSNMVLYCLDMFISTILVDVDVCSEEEFFNVLKLQLAMYVLYFEGSSVVHLYYLFYCHCNYQFFFFNKLGIACNTLMTHGISLMYMMSTFRVKFLCRSTIPVGRSSIIATTCTVFACTASEYSLRAIYIFINKDMCDVILTSEKNSPF